MSLTLVQRQTAATTVAQSSALTATYSPAPKEGNLLVCGCTSGATMTMTSTGWTLATSAVNNVGLYQWYKIAGASESTSVSITPSSSVGMVMYIEEWSGNLEASPLDQVGSQAVQSSTSTPTTGTTPATAQTDELAIGQIGSTSSSGVGSYSAWSNAFSEVLDITGQGSQPYGLGVAEKALSATGAQSTIGTNSETLTQYSGLIATYKAAPITRQWFSRVAHAAGTSWTTSFGGNPVREDDVHILFLATGTSTAAVTGGLSGWTLLAGPTDNGGVADVRCWLYWRKAVAGDTAPVVTFDTSHAGQSIITCYRDTNAPSPWDGSLIVYSSATAQAFTNLEKTTTAVNEMLVSFIAEDKSGTLAHPNFTITAGGLTVYVDTEEAVEWTQVGAADGLKAAAGAETVSWAHDSDGIVAYLGALRLAGSADVSADVPLVNYYAPMRSF